MIVNPNFVLEFRYSTESNYVISIYVRKLRSIPDDFALFCSAVINRISETVVTTGHWLLIYRVYLIPQSTLLISLDQIDSSVIQPRIRKLGRRFLLVKHWQTLTGLAKFIKSIDTFRSSQFLSFIKSWLKRHSNIDNGRKTSSPIRWIQTFRRDPLAPSSSSAGKLILLSEGDSVYKSAE